MGRRKLTKSVIDSASPRHAGDLYIWDYGSGAVSGFGLKVTPKGSKIFCFQYRAPNARNDRRYRIGKFGDWTVGEARQRARKLRQMVDMQRVAGEPFPPASPPDRPFRQSGCSGEHPSHSSTCRLASGPWACGPLCGSFYFTPDPDHWLKRKALFHLLDGEERHGGVAESIRHHGKSPAIG